MFSGFILPVKHEDPLLEIQKKFLSLAEEAMKAEIPYFLLPLLAQSLAFYTLARYNKLPDPNEKQEKRGSE
ncbi:MAG: hypothetical protein ACLSA6_09790 [Holdemania massiliensis]